MPAILRIRYGLQPAQEYEISCDDEAPAIIGGKASWPHLYELAIVLPSTITVTVIDHQRQVCWERQAPIALERDRSLSDDAWVLHVLRRHGQLSRPRLIAVAGLKPSAKNVSSLAMHE
jgi:hypothetical protein